MKKNILVVLLLLLIVNCRAQNFSVLPNDSIESTNNVNDWMSDYIHISNTSGGSLNLSFQTIVNTMDPIGWDVLLCTSNGCYSYVPSAGSLGTLAAGDSAHLNLICGFMGIAGSGEVSVKVYETGNPSNADTVTFIYHAVSTAGIFDNTENNASALSQNFPNPFTTSTSIKYNLEEGNGKLIVTDIQGKSIREFILKDKTGEVVIDADLVSGIYFYSLLENNKIVSKKKMIVK